MGRRTERLRSLRLPHIVGGVGSAKHVPKSHEHVLEHFTKLTDKLGDHAIEAAKLLNRVRSVRMTADHGGAEPPDQEALKMFVADASPFVEICVRWLGLPPTALPAASAETE
jgi:hypothetical protein